MHDTFREVPEDKKIELPVFENTQLGMSLGLALAGYLPISIFPRWSFLLCAMDQLVNHLNQWEKMGGGAPRVIIRTATPSRASNRLDPGPQHIGAYTAKIRDFVPNVQVVDLMFARDVVPAYLQAAEHLGPSLLVERQELY